MEAISSIPQTNQRKEVEEEEDGEEEERGGNRKQLATTKDRKRKSGWRRKSQQGGRTQLMKMVMRTMIRAWGITNLLVKGDDDVTITIRRGNTKTRVNRR